VEVVKVSVYVIRVLAIWIYASVNVWWLERPIHMPGVEAL
jgi:hypothetical protein